MSLILSRCLLDVFCFKHDCFRLWNVSFNQFCVFGFVTVLGDLPDPLLDLMSRNLLEELVTTYGMHECACTFMISEHLSKDSSMQFDSLN